MHMLKLQDGEVPENLYGEFNPFEYFPTNQNGEKDGGVYRQGLAPTREGFQSGILLGCEVLGLLMGATQGCTKAAATHSAKESLNLESIRRVRYAWEGIITFAWIQSLTCYS